MPTRRHLQHVIESAIDFAVIVTDLEGIVTDWNTGAERIFGWPRDEMIGGSADRIFTPADRAADRPGEEMRIATAAGRADDERWHLRRSGERFWATGEMMPLRTEQGAHRGYVKIVRDRTGQRETGERLRVSEDRFSALLESVDTAFALVQVRFDADDRPVDYRFIEANPAFERQAGVNLRGRWVTEFAPDLERFWFETYGHVARTGEPATFESYAKAFGRWFDVRAVRVGDPAERRIAIFFNDVTARRQLAARNAAIQELSDRLRDMTESRDIAGAAAEILGKTLAASLVGFGTVDPETEMISVERDWSDEGVRRLPELIRPRDYGSHFDDLKRGETVVVNDVATDPRMAAFTANLQAIGARAFVNLPMFEQGRLVALLYVGQQEARVWTDDEIMFLRDVAERIRAATERVRGDKDLRESQLRYRRLFDTIDEGFCVIRFIDGPHGPFGDYVHVEANSAFEHHLGLPHVAGQTLRDIAPDEETGGWLRIYGDVLRTGRPIRFQRAFGPTERTLEVAAHRVEPADRREVAVLFTDVTARTQAEAALRASEALAQVNIQRVQLAHEAGAIIGTWFWDLPSDRFTVDEAFARSFGLDPALGREGIPLAQIVETVHPDDQEGLAEAINEAIARGGKYAHQYRVRRADGKYYWLEANGRVDHAPDGTPLSFPGVLLDVEERRAVEAQRDRAAAELRSLNETLEQRVAERTAELIRAEEALRQSQKMEAVGQLTGGLAHDFNNLLAGITGSLDLMSARISQGRVRDVDKYIVAAQGAAKRAAALTHRLLAFSRRQTLDPKPTDVNRLVSELEDLVRRTVGPAVHVEVVGAPGLWTTLVDPNQLENALLNLCINARDAMPDGGRITIETANRWLDTHAARERELEPGQYLSLCVSDTGTGMPPEVVAKAFDPFFTTKPIGQGTGLGLSMIYGFARQSGGQVRIYSEIGKGTMICIYLPRFHGDADRQTQGAAANPIPFAQAGETVLIVDDEPTVRMLVTDVLEDLGYNAIEASDSLSGLKVLRSDVRIDLLVTDVGLPGGMNGRQMADAGREVRPDLKVLFITGYAENAVVGNGHLDPGMQVMTKPFSVDALATRLREIIEA